MAIDYLIHFDCKAKEALGTTGVVDLVKARQRGLSLLKRFMADGMEESTARQVPFTIQRQGPDGMENRQVSVEQLLKEASLLDDHAHHCQECPAGQGMPYGCFGTINYPISAAAEEWLAELAAQALAKGLPDAILLKFIMDQQVRGDLFGNMRSNQPGQFMESLHPIEIEGDLPVFEEPISVNTNQLLDMLFAVGDMQDVHQQFVLFFSGGLSLTEKRPDPARLGVDIQAVGLKDEGGQEKYWVFSVPDRLEDDWSIRQLKAYLRTVFAAYSTGAALGLDY